MPIDDSVVIAEGATGAIIATDLVTSGSTTANYQYVKMTWGPDGTVNPVSETGTSGPIPTQLYSNGVQITNTSGRLNVDLQGSGITLNTRLIGGATMAVSAIGGGTLDHVTIAGGTIDKVSSATVVGGTLDHVTIAGGTIDKISSATVIGGTLDHVTIAGGTIDKVSSATVVGGTLDHVTIAGGTIDKVSSATVVGGTLDHVTVSGATITNMPGLTFGTRGYSGGTLGSFDSVIVQGATGAFPVTTALAFITADGSFDYFGKSGDALKVALTDSAFSATVNVGSVIGVNSQNTLAVAGTSGASSEFAPITIAGTANSALAVGITTATGVTLPISGPVTVTGTVATSGTVTATDLDIRGLTGGTWGATAGLGTLEDSIVVQGSTGAFPVATALAGFTIDGSPVLLQTEVVDATTQILKTVIDGRGITNATALQVQGRNDGSTVDPVKIAGVGGTGDVSPTEGLVGVTFDLHPLGIRVRSGLTAPGALGLAGASASAIATLLHGASGTSILPIGLTNDALKVAMVNADGISFSVNVASDIKITNNTSTEALPVKGSDLGNTGIYITGTGGTSEPFPIMIRGYTTERGASSANQPVQITSTQLSDVISGNTGSLELTYRGLTGICAALDSLTDSINTANNTNASVIETVNGLASDIDTDLNTLVDADAGVLSFVGAPDDRLNVSKRAYIEVPPPVSIAQEALPATNTATPFTDDTTLKSGARFKLHPGADQVVFIGSGTNTNVFYPLSAGDDIFIEIDKINRISVFAPTAGTNLTVFALGF